MAEGPSLKGRYKSDMPKLAGLAKLSLPRGPHGQRKGFWIERRPMSLDVLRQQEEQLLEARLSRRPQIVIHRASHCDAVSNAKAFCSSSSSAPCPKYFEGLAQITRLACPDSLPVTSKAPVPFT